jgi:hypothetical protein
MIKFGHIIKKKDLVSEDRKKLSIDSITSNLKKYKDVAVTEMKQTRLLVRILMSASKEYLKNKDFELDKEDKEFIKNQSSDILKLIPLVVFQIVPGSSIATPFIIKLGEKLGIKLNTKVPEKYKETIYEYETRLNDEKSRINILDPSLILKVETSIQEILNSVAIV